MLRRRGLAPLAPVVYRQTLGLPLSSNQNGDKIDSLKAKRKVGIVLGYIGTDFHGLQMANWRKSAIESAHNSGDHALIDAVLDGRGNVGVVRTVELELERALFAAGCIKKENLGDLDRLGWSRMARTDAGVHATRTLVSGNLLVDVVPFEPPRRQHTSKSYTKTRVANSSWEHRSLKNAPATVVAPGAMTRLSATLDASLKPLGVRCWGAAVMPKSFSSRHACAWREYEYMFPRRMLLTPFPPRHDDGDPFPPRHDDGDGREKEKEGVGESVERLKEALKAFEGVHTFHNFTRRSAVAKKKKKRENMDTPAASPAAAADGVSRLSRHGGERGNDLATVGEHHHHDPRHARSSAQEKMEEEEEEQDQGPGVMYRIPGEEEDARRRHRADEVKKEMSKLPQTKRTITACELVDTNPVTIRGEEYLSIRVRGDSFLYNQIRFMVGGALAVGRGALPLWALQAALHGNWYVRMPLAPPDGLMLLDAGLERCTSKRVTFQQAPPPPPAPGGGGGDAKTSSEHSVEIGDVILGGPFAQEELKRRQRRNLSFPQLSRRGRHHHSHHQGGRRNGRVKGGKVGGEEEEEEDRVVLMDDCAVAAMREWRERELVPHVAETWASSAHAHEWARGLEHVESSSDAAMGGPNQAGRLEEEEGGEGVATNPRRRSVLHWRPNYDIETLSARWVEAKQAMEHSTRSARARDDERRKFWIQKARSLKEQEQEKDLEQQEEEQSRTNESGGKKKRGGGRRVGGEDQRSVIGAGEGLVRGRDVLPQRFGSTLAIALRCSTAHTNLALVLQVLAEKVVSGQISEENEGASQQDLPSETELLAYVFRHRLS